MFTDHFAVTFVNGRYPTYQIGRKNMVNLPVTSEQYQHINPNEWRARLDKRLAEREKDAVATGDDSALVLIRSLRNRIAFPGAVVV